MLQTICPVYWSDTQYLLFTETVMGQTMITSIWIRFFRWVFFLPVQYVFLVLTWCLIHNVVCALVWCVLWIFFWPIKNGRGREGEEHNNCIYLHLEQRKMKLLFKLLMKCFLLLCFIGLELCLLFSQFFSFFLTGIILCVVILHFSVFLDYLWLFQFKYWKVETTL